MSSKNFIKKLFNRCAENLNNALNDKYQIPLYIVDKSEKEDCIDGISDLSLINLSNNKNMDNNDIEKQNYVSNSDNKLNALNSNDSKEIKKSSASHYYSENLEDKIAEQIYDFFEILIIQPEHTISKLSKKYKSSDKQTKNLLKFIENKINSNSNFYFTDLKILNNVLYFTDDKIVEIQPLIILMNYHFSDISKKLKQPNLEGQIKIQIELFFEFDDPENVFVSQNKFANKCGVFKISRLSILEFNKKISTDVFEIPVENQMKNLENNNKEKTKKVTKLNKFMYNLSDTNDSISINEYSKSNSDEIINYKKNKNNKKIDENYTFHAENYSETINSLIPEKIIITDNSPQTYSN
tara:strand:+ start:1175 stop:2233 length:1059 start_codon:yes stop_codon:yes gene_type:complete